MLNSKFIIANDKIIELVQIPGTLRWVTNDEYRTEFAMNEESQTKDPVTRCGVGALSLSPNNKLTDACRAHDFAYNSPTYQAFHTREEADSMLRSLMAKLKPQQHWLAETFYKITRWFGAKFWENKETND